MPREKPIPPEPFDWSFDGFRPTTSAVKERLYRECARFHPEILDREASALSPKLKAAPSPRMADCGSGTPTTKGYLSGSAHPPRPPKGTTPTTADHFAAKSTTPSTADYFGSGGYVPQQRKLSTGCPPGPPASRKENVPQSEGTTPSAADYFGNGGYVPQQRKLSAGCPPGPPTSRKENVPQSARSSPGYGYPSWTSTSEARYNRQQHEAALSCRTSEARYSHECYSHECSPQAPYVAPPRSMIPQPNFASRSAHVSHSGRSLTPQRQRVLAR